MSKVDGLSFNARGVSRNEGQSIIRFILKIIFIKKTTNIVYKKINIKRDNL